MAIIQADVRESLVSGYSSSSAGVYMNAPSKHFPRYYYWNA